MPMLDAPFFRKYLLPGFVFQSIVIGGGYGTGRELVEYFLQFGPLGRAAGDGAVDGHLVSRLPGDLRVGAADQFL